jgi:hypothetical protein
MRSIQFWRDMTTLAAGIALIALICMATAQYLREPRETGETLRYIGEHEL